MSHEHGAYLGSVRGAEELRLRCVIESNGQGCWHLRTSRGRPMPKGQTMRVWVHGKGSISARVAAWGLPLPAGHCIVATCQTHDCVRPSHLRCVPKGEAVALAAARGEWTSDPRRAAANLRNGMLRAKLTHELAQWVRDSPQSRVECAIALGVSASVVGNIRDGRAWRVTGWCSQ